ncbi:hypothetical protein [Methylobacterium nigriterrae]|uniref:hypothetical protein n=1 Tax=Methylobacterium nigriterrae TaxID=3127512 RepID=UPI0030139ADE
MAGQTREEKLAEIERINRTLNRGVTEVREEDRTIKRDLKHLYRRRDELLAETGGLDDAGPVPTGRVRQVRMIGSKGY